MGEQSFGIELHDSEITQVRVTVHALVLGLKAYVHHSSGVPGNDPGTGWVHAAEIRIGGGISPPGMPELPATILDGRLQLDERHLDNVVPADLRFSGRTELLLTFESGEVIRLGGSWIKCLLLDDGQFVESFAGRNLEGG